jgi:hypothetical protein
MELLPSIDGVTPFMAQEDGKLIQGTLQDCTAIAQDAKERQAIGMHGSHDMKHAARLPVVAVETYCNVNGISFEDFMKDPAHIKRVCNDPALAAFRVWPGRL